MKLTHVPGFVGRWHGDRHSVLERQLMRFINCGRRFQPPAHPDASRLVVPGEFWPGAAARTLCALAEKYLHVTTAHGAEARRLAPVPGFFPAQLRKPIKAFNYVRNVQYWS